MPRASSEAAVAGMCRGMTSRAEQAQVAEVMPPALPNRNDVMVERRAAALPSQTRKPYPWSRGYGLSSQDRSCRGRNLVHCPASLVVGCLPSNRQLLDGHSGCRCSRTHGAAEQPTTSDPRSSGHPREGTESILRFRCDQSPATRHRASALESPRAPQFRLRRLHPFCCSSS